MLLRNEYIIGEVASFYVLCGKKLQLEMMTQKIAIDGDGSLEVVTCSRCWCFCKVEYEDELELIVRGKARMMQGR